LMWPRAIQMCNDCRHAVGFDIDRQTRSRAQRRLGAISCDEQLGLQDGASVGRDAGIISITRFAVRRKLFFDPVQTKNLHRLGQHALDLT
jgi:hypothetical protein